MKSYHLLSLIVFALATATAQEGAAPNLEKEIQRLLQPQNAGYLIASTAGVPESVRIQEAILKLPPESIRLVSRVLEHSTSEETDLRHSALKLLWRLMDRRIATPEMTRRAFAVVKQILVERPPPKVLIAAFPILADYGGDAEFELLLLFFNHSEAYIRERARGEAWSMISRLEGKGAADQWRKVQMETETKRPLSTPVPVPQPAPPPLKK